jgi:ribulose-phosphate 3-epimerase
MSRGKIAPSILSADFGRLADQVRAVDEAGADWIHVDVMDGHFVPNLTIGPVVVEAVRKATKLPLDVHLMIENPERYVDDYVRAGADHLTVHVEACRHLHAVLQQIKAAGAMPAVVLNPGTPVSLLEPVLGDVGMVLVMSVNPGFGGQKFIGHSLAKLSELKALRARLGLSFWIEIDGGVKVENTREVAAAGAEAIVSGTGIFGAADWRATIAAMRRELDAGLAGGG